MTLTILRDGEVSDMEVNTDVVLPLGDATTRLVLWCGALVQEMYPGGWAWHCTALHCATCRDTARCYMPWRFMVPRGVALHGAA